VERSNLTINNQLKLLHYIHPIFRNHRPVYFLRDHHIFISILLLLTFGGESVAFSAGTGSLIYSDSVPLDYDDDYLRNRMEPYVPVPVSNLSWIGVETLCDQGFVSSVFRPPASIF